MEFKDFTTPHPDKLEFKRRLHQLADVIAMDVEDETKRPLCYYGMLATLSFNRYEIAVDDFWENRHKKMVLMKFELPLLINSSKKAEANAQDYYKFAGHALAKKN